jgi:hypothetical protein
MFRDLVCQRLTHVVVRTRRGLSLLAALIALRLSLLSGCFSTLFPFLVCFGSSRRLLLEPLLPFFSGTLHRALRLLVHRLLPQVGRQRD